MKLITRSSLFVVATLALVAAMPACKSSDKSMEVEEPLTLEQKCQATVARFKEADPGLEKWFSDAAGYALFPTIGKGGLIVGGAHGDGLLFVDGESIGRTTVTQGSIGLQAGGQSFSEVVFFRTPADVDIFKRGNFELDATASAVAVTAGEAATNDYSKGVAIFTLVKGGLMVEASVGGQKFKFEPKS